MYPFVDTHSALFFFTDNLKKHLYFVPRFYCYFVPRFYCQNIDSRLQLSELCNDFLGGNFDGK